MSIGGRSEKGRRDNQLYLSHSGIPELQPKLTVRNKRFELQFKREGRKLRVGL